VAEPLADQTDGWLEIKAQAKPYQGSRKNNFTFLSADPSRLAALRKLGIS